MWRTRDGRDKLVWIALATVLVFCCGYAYGWRQHRYEPSAPVMPMPHAWQVMVVPPGWGDYASTVTFGETLRDALDSVGQLPESSYAETRIPAWIAGAPCSGTGMRTRCNAVRNPVKYDENGNRVPR